MSFRKINSLAIEKKFLFREIIWQIIKLQILMYAFCISLVLIFAFFLLANQPLSFAIIVPIYLFCMVFYYNYFGKIAYKFFFWLFETPEAAEHRQKWLSFREFVTKYSALEERPIKYYELWGEFYYYALAVGAIKKP